MSLYSFIKRLVETNSKDTRSVVRNKRKNKSGLSFEKLETRKLLASISFDSGTVTVAGDSGNNVGSFSQVNSSTFRASLTGLSSQDFAASDVNRIVFIGFGGNDTFTNATAVDGLLLGNDGNDELNGGSGFDQINGGQGNDVIRGNNGNDRLIGGFGDDAIRGGNGNDSIFGTSGLNMLRGDAGNDIIYGGDEVDHIFGDSGIDNLFGLDGDDIIDVGDGGIEGSAGTAQADLALGLNGVDTITGGTGLNVLYGGNGNDILTGGTGQNRLHGQNGNDQLTGGNNDDFLAGQLGDDTIQALGGNDFILPSFGNDIVDGGTGNDFDVFTSTSDNYRITGATPELTVRDRRGFEGVDQVDNAERFRFTDGDQDAEANIVQVVTVQPIIVSNSDGSNTAEYFGNSDQEANILELIDDIYVQAQIDIEFLPPVTWNNTFANVGNRRTRPLTDLNTVVETGDAFGPGNSDPLVIDLYFVERSAGFADTGENVTNGLAFVGGNGITMHVGDNLVDFQAGRDVVAQVAAHEIAHNLGLDHTDDDPNNLMFEGEGGSTGSALTPEQIAMVLDSEFSRPV